MMDSKGLITNDARKYYDALKIPFNPETIFENTFKTPDQHVLRSKILGYTVYQVKTAINFAMWRNSIFE